MNFSDLLSGYIGSNIEVFLPNAFHTGELTNVEASYFTIAVNDSSYYQEPTNVRVLSANVEFVRILT